MVLNMNQIYDVINSNGEKIGWINDKLLLRIREEKDDNFENIEDLIVKVEFMDCHLNDMQGDLYSLAIHKELIKQINKFGIGYMVR
jgi:hypothetical protein